MIGPEDVDAAACQAGYLDKLGGSTTPEMVLCHGSSVLPDRVEAIGFHLLQHILSGSAAHQSDDAAGSFPWQRTTY